MVDTRIFEKEGKLYLTYNRYLERFNTLLGFDCSQYCAIMYISEVVINDNIIFIRDVNPLCVDLMSSRGSRIEKNWSFANLNHPEKLSFNYWLFSDNNKKTKLLEYDLSTKNFFINNLPLITGFMRGYKRNAFKNILM